MYIHILNNNIKHWHGNTNIPLYYDDIYIAKTAVYRGITLFAIFRQSITVYTVKYLNTYYSFFPINVNSTAVIVFFRHRLNSINKSMFSVYIIIYRNFLYPYIGTVNKL